MSYGQPCRYNCGATLDPGEKCDCDGVGDVDGGSRQQVDVAVETQVAAVGEQMSLFDGSGVRRKGFNSVQLH